MGAADPFDLQRFVTAQAPVFASALEELKEGRKRTHLDVVPLSAAARARVFVHGHVLRYRIP